MAKLIFSGGALDGHEVVLSSDEITAGRADQCDFTIPDSRVSGSHCKFMREDNIWWIYDLNSSNGTKVNDEVVQAVELKEGDRIVVGDTTLCFTLQDGPVMDKGGPSVKQQPHAPEQRLSGLKLPPKPVVPGGLKLPPKPDVSGLKLPSKPVVSGLKLPSKPNVGGLKLPPKPSMSGIKMPPKDGVPAIKTEPEAEKPAPKMPADGLKLPPKPEMPGGLKLPPKPDVSGLKLPPKPNVSGLKLPPKPDVSGLKLPPKPESSKPADSAPAPIFVKPAIAEPTPAAFVEPESVPVHESEPEVQHVAAQEAVRAPEPVVAQKPALTAEPVVEEPIREEAKGPQLSTLEKFSSQPKLTPAQELARRKADAAAASAGVGKDDVKLIEELKVIYQQMKVQLGRVIIGQSAVVEEVLIAVFARGHALLVGVPGLAKTLLISTLSHVLDLGFKRVQFTPDLMPSDITGTDVLEEDKATGKRIFRFVEGPVFANMLLADEINRTPPKTQAALLEAMQEHRVTVGSHSYQLPKPFFVLATQNPIEQEGTYPLPEAQLDRFLFNIVVDYPSADEESQIIRAVTSAKQNPLDVVLNGEDVLRLQDLVRRVPVADHVIDFARDLVRATRPKQPDVPDFVKEMVGWGAGPRAGISLVTAAKARAILHGRMHATTADVSAVAHPVLRHRVITTFNAEAAGVTSDNIIDMLLKHFKPKKELDI